MKKIDISYQAAGVECQARVCHDGTQNAKKPAVLLVHAFEGQTDAYRQQAENLVAAGYVGIAIDMYGHGQTSDNLDGCLKLMNTLTEDRSLCRQRLLDTYRWAQQLEMVDSSKIAIMGFCFGGLCALDLARTGERIAGAISIHGSFDRPPLDDNQVNCPILILHGYQDPLVPPESLKTLAQELDSYGADWQALFFSQTKHAFTDQEASKIGPKELGREYNPLSSYRSWKSVFLFLDEVFSS